MKTFNDLQFEEHPNSLYGGAMFSDARHALLFFDNGYGISVISGRAFYTSPLGPYEVAVLSGNAEGWDLTYDTPITNDVIGHCTEKKVSSIMKKIQKLESCQS